MGRRALRKIDPRLDLSDHLKTFDELPSPWDAAALFGRRGPLEIDVGAGKGLYVRTAAAGCPDVDFLGIEVRKKYARFAAAALAKRELPNAKMIAGDALRIFAELLPDESLSAVHVYFPDPWWKMRHRKRRVMQEPFMRNVERTLRPGGILHFRTDVAEYFEETLALLAQHTRLIGPMEVALPSVEASDEGTVGEDAAPYRTHFERRMHLNDEPVYRAEYRKPPAKP